jgi:hypothetical protein
MVPRIPEIDLISDTKICFGCKNWAGILFKECLLELGHDLVHFVIWVAAGGACIYRFPTQSAGGALLVEEGALGSAGAFKFTVFKENQSYGHQNEEEGDEAQCDQESCHTGYICANLMLYFENVYTESIVSTPCLP